MRTPGRRLEGGSVRQTGGQAGELPPAFPSSLQEGPPLCLTDLLGAFCLSCLSFLLPTPALSSTFLPETRKSSESAIPLSLPCSPPRPILTVPLCPARPGSGFIHPWLSGGTGAGRSSSGATMLGVEPGVRAWHRVMGNVLHRGHPTLHTGHRQQEVLVVPLPPPPLLFSMLSAAGA